MPDSKNRDTVQQYVGDMFALISHIEEAMDGQLKEVKNHQPSVLAVRRFHDMVKGHKDELRSHLKSIGGSESSPIKEFVANLFGKAAGVIDNVRTKGESKALRDDYTAFNHAAVGYAMLHTTAHALGEQSTMQLAERHLRDYAQAVQEINQLIPDITVYELREEGHALNDEAVPHCREVINRIWQETSPNNTGHSSIPKAA